MDYLVVLDKHAQKMDQWLQFPEKVTAPIVEQETVDQEQLEPVAEVEDDNVPQEADDAEMEEQQQQETVDENAQEAKENIDEQVQKPETQEHAITKGADFPGYDLLKNQARNSTCMPSPPSAFAQIPQFQEIHSVRPTSDYSDPKNVSSQDQPVKAASASPRQPEAVNYGYTLDASMFSLPEEK